MTDGLEESSQLPSSNTLDLLALLNDFGLSSFEKSSSSFDGTMAYVNIRDKVLEDLNFTGSSNEADDLQSIKQGEAEAGSTMSTEKEKNIQIGVSDNNCSSNVGNYQKKGLQAGLVSARLVIESEWRRQQDKRREKFRLLLQLVKKELK